MLAYLCTSWPFNYLFVLFIIFLVTHNSRIRQFVFLDSRGITSWSYESVYNTGTPLKLIAKTFQFFVILKGTCKCNCYTQTVPSCLCLMDLYIAEREILENFPKIILGKSLQLLLCVAPVNIALTVAQITFQRRFRGEGELYTVTSSVIQCILDCLLPASRFGKKCYCHIFENGPAGSA